MRNKLPVVVLGLLALGFGAGLWQLIRLRFGNGTVYPEFSSLRSDPLGAKALFDSLSMLPGLTVTRNVRRLGGLRGTDQTLLFLGVEPGAYIEDAARPDLERIAGDGGRIVIAFLPVWPMSRFEQRNPAQDQAKHVPHFLDRLGVVLTRAPAVSKASERPLTGGLPRFTSLYFDKLSPEWKVRRSRAGHALTIERAFRRGSLVLVADSWLLSNEALTSEPDPEELAWLAGPNRKITFDETHLGIEESGSVAELVRRYRLHGLVAAVIVLGGLFVWSRSSSFIPPLTIPASDATVAGRSAISGLSGLLERSIPPGALMAICLREWEASESSRSEALRAAVRQAAAELPRTTDPVAAYGLMRRKLAETSHKWKQPSLT